MKKTVVIGASPDTSRYAYLACKMLDDAGFDFVPVGIKKGKVLSNPILSLSDKPSIKDVHTVTMYISPKNQLEWYDYIISLNPKRLIFNPGTGNEEFGQMAEKKGIKVEYACNLVLIQTGQF